MTKLTTTLIAGEPITITTASPYNPLPEYIKTIHAQLDICLNITSQFGLQSDDCKDVHERLNKVKDILKEIFK